MKLNYQFVLCQTQGVCIRKKDFKETSQIVCFYTRDFGKTFLLTKGARRFKTRFYGAFDLFCVYNVHFIRRPQTNICITSDCLEYFPDLRKDTKKYYCACYICNFIDEFTRENIAGEGIFELLVNSLSDLCNDFHGTGIILSFTARALKFFGYLSPEENCKICRRSIKEFENLFFCCRNGGGVCIDCSRDVQKGVFVSSDSLKMLNAIMREDTGVLVPEFYSELSQIFDEYTSYLLGRELKIPVASLIF